MNTDTTFITNEAGQTLKDRFEILIKDSRFFDCLVGYFYSSGFHALYKALEKTEKIRVLIGISTSKQVFDLINQSANSFLNVNQNNTQLAFQMSHAQVKDEFEEITVNELDNSKDSKETEEGVEKFIEWIKSGKLTLKAYPSQNIHAKLYIMTFVEGDKDTGRVITGSSNFSQSGLVDNLEFNVELKNRVDYEFALTKFNQLWADAVDVSQKYIDTINKKTWLSQDVTPYELYLKFLYEYFKDELSQTDELYSRFLPENFLKLEYQEQAVLNARRLLEEYGGVFISDVVGLGKTYISALLAGQLSGRHLVIAPPALLNLNNPGSWRNVFFEFGIPAIFESIGKLDAILKINPDSYHNVFIDEAHRFRTETNISYEKLAEICRGKRVILVTATPYNNSPKDILSQIKLFQSSRKSTIPNLANLEGFFGSLEQKLSRINRKTNYYEYINTVKENAKEIRDKVLKYLMVRRTRKEIEQYFPKDLALQGLKFPEVESPKPLYYELNDLEDEIFSNTIELITQKFSYARYMPLLYYKGKITQLEQQSQKNMGKFMKILLVKRLESSFYAFRKTLDRFISSYEMFISIYEKGSVYLSKKYLNKIFEFLENDQDDKVIEFIDEGKAQQFFSDDFEDNFIADLKKDRDILYQIRSLWQDIKRDPKLIKFIDSLSKNDILKKNKLIIFTESKETAQYLTSHVNEKFDGTALFFSGSSPEAIRDTVIDNFDARARDKKDDYRVLISTEVLSEGVNLHRSNVVINYDIPWNPTRMMQRVGRINRVDTKFDNIYTYNFFPTKQSNDQIQLEQIAKSKINAFLTLLGGDAEILTEGEPVGSHELFNRLFSKQVITGEEELEESDLKYLTLIKNIRENDKEMFEKIKRLPKKARTSKAHPEIKDSLLTYFRKDKLDKFYLSNISGDISEHDFISAAKVLESSPSEEKFKIPPIYYEMLDKNKEAFIYATTEELVKQDYKAIKDSSQKLLGILKFTLKNTQRLTDEQEEYLRKVREKLEEGSIPKQTLKETLSSISKLGKDGLLDPVKVYATLRINISSRFLQSHFIEHPKAEFGIREVILSLYLKGK
jgi:superfamily II DNA or RNA helicase